MQRLGLFLLSAAALAFEVNLTRLFSVAQFYHFAFMTVSLALLGFGASGTLLSLAPGLTRRPHRTLVACAWGFAASAVGSYLLTLYVPFDSFRVSIAPAQWGVLALHYLALAVPFLCTGAAVGLWLTVEPQATGRTYAANLTGSAAGCLLAVTLPALSGAVGVVLLCAALGLLAALVFALAGRPPHARHLPPLLLAAVLLIVAIRPPAFLQPRLSPYKGLSTTLQLPDARLVFQDWNSISRVDVVDSSGIRSMAGQGFACSQAPPPQRGLFVDGDDLSPITYLSRPADLRPLTDCLLTALPYRLRPGASTVVLNPRGGFDLWVALAEGAREVAAVEPNPLLVRAVREQGAWAGNLYDRPEVRLFVEEERAFLARPGPRYDVIVLPSPGTYHPVTSGAYSLAEDYRYTVEGFVAALERLDEDGLLVVVRWLQAPPSEEVRAFALAATALERLGSDPAQSLVALRSYSQMLILARRGPFTPEEIGTVRDFAAARAFDLVYVPGVQADEVNRYNLLPSPDTYLACIELLTAEDRAAWLAAYPFDVTPPTDDRPFFGHFFRWRQAGQVLAQAGHVWQPFGGAGYLVLLALLAVATLSAGMLVLLPLSAPRRPDLAVAAARGQKGRRLSDLLPFALLGLAYLFVEIPLLQRFILFLGHPTYAMAAVLGTLLFFSGVGSQLSPRVPRGMALLTLVGLLILCRAALPLLSGPLLGWPLAARAALTVVGLAPLGVLMGIPFPATLALLQQKAPGLTAWAWGVNGALSVVASVLAALLALSWGFGAVLLLGAACYLAVWLTTTGPAGVRGSSHPTTGT
jgi:hypothetical protein